jgi:hypothetical protein
MPKTSTILLVGGGVVAIGGLIWWMNKMRTGIPRPGLPGEVPQMLPDRVMMPQGFGPADSYIAVGDDGTPGAGGFTRPAAMAKPPSLTASMAAESQPDAQFVASETRYDAPMSAGSTPMIGASSSEGPTDPGMGVMARRQAASRTTPPSGVEQATGITPSAYGY